MNKHVSPSELTATSRRSVDSIRAPLNFLRRQATKPAFLSTAITGGAPEYHYETETHTVTISDMRRIANGLSIDREGFELVRHATAVDAFYDDTIVKQTYVAETEEFLRRRFDASRVEIFDVTRRSDDGAGADNPEGRRSPASKLHVDYTARSGPQRVKDILGDDEAARLSASGARIMQINVWRPIRGPVARSPLALADASSIGQAELIATDQVFPHRIGEIYNIAYSPSQRWFYAPQMTPDEVLLIKGWDSLDDGRARFAPHGAFQLPETRIEAPARESIELRAFIIIETPS
ncbi:MAG: CmcJ/NvfI family oxidoreductase [Hyphomicrobiaceae bacterium]